MHPADCPRWEYADHPRRAAVLRTEIPKLLAELRKGALKTEEIAGDNRPIHGRLFSQLTPPGFQYYAGHFRGENFRCLKFCPVSVLGDPRGGFPPQTVFAQMDAFIYRVRLALAKIDVLAGDPLAQLTHSVRLACHLLEAFLRIHPYTNGNGHIARLIVWAVLGRYGRWPERWPIEPRPPNPPYVALIMEYRNGNQRPLEEFMINAILGT
jgi:hypothetical protein